MYNTRYYRSTLNVIETFLELTKYPQYLNVEIFMKHSQERSQDLQGRSCAISRGIDSLDFNNYLSLQEKH